jgi:hypothetical protein
MDVAMNGWRAALACVALIPLACNKGADPSAGATTATTPSADPPAATPAAAPAKPAGNPCPAGATKGTGTSADPCLATGSNRAIQVTWTGKTGQRAEFTLKNVSGKAITNISSNVYYYDKAGKVLTVKNGHMVPGWTGAFALGANETKTQEMGLLKAEIPAGAAAIEAETQAVQFDTGEFGKDVYWANYDLSAYDRPKGGAK